MSKEFQFADLHVTLRAVSDHLQALHTILSENGLNEDDKHTNTTFGLVSALDDMILLNEPQSPEAHEVYRATLDEYRKDDAVGHRLAEILIRTKLGEVAAAA